MPVLTPRRRSLASLIVAAGLIALLASWAPEHSGTYIGSAAVIGKGRLESYVVLTAAGAPAALGVHLTEGALQQLPVHKNRRSRCFDLNSDASIAASECVGDEERILQLPAEIVGRAQLPFRWISVNWNAEGHHPPPPKPGEAPTPPIYARPHFDCHFFAWDRDRVEAIAAGPCGEFVDCGDFERGRKPIPSPLCAGGTCRRRNRRTEDGKSPARLAVARAGGTLHPIHPDVHLWGLRRRADLLGADD